MTKIHKSAAENTRSCGIRAPTYGLHSYTNGIELSHRSHGYNNSLSVSRRVHGEKPGAMPLLSFDEPDLVNLVAGQWGEV